MRRLDDELAASSPFTRRDLYVAAAVGTCLIAGTVLGFAARGFERGVNSASAGPSALPVATLRVQPQPAYEARRLFVGRVEPRCESAVGFELGGLLQALGVDEGDDVQVGVRDPPAPRTAADKRARGRGRQPNRYPLDFQAGLRQTHDLTLQSPLERFADPIMWVS